MTLTLRYQSTGTVPGSGAPVAMVGNSLTIGRGDENDMVLPDPDRMISKNHCVIENHAGNIVIVDLSTNGTFLNYGKIPLGKIPTPLNDGDILSMGSYELLVDVTAKTADPTANIADPLAEGPVSPGQAEAAPDTMSLLDDPAAGGDFLDDLLGGSKPPTGPGQMIPDDFSDDDLLPPLGAEDDGILAPAPPPPPQGASAPEHNPSTQDAFRAPGPAAQTIPDDWDDLLTPAADSEAPFAQPEAAAPPIAAPIPDTPAAQPAPVAPPEPVTMAPVAAASAGDSAAARAFLQAAGAGELQIPDAELAETLARLGNVFKILVQGLREILMTRTSIKSEFRMNQTMIGAGGNNPLKFSISPEQAIEVMVKPTTKGYLEASAAAEQALQDIKAHEIAMITGMEAALKGILKRLSPEELEGKIETSASFGSILKGKKARYWEVFEKIYAEISDEAENDFHELFSKEFVRAYQNQLERLK